MIPYQVTVQMRELVWQNIALQFILSKTCNTAPLGFRRMLKYELITEYIHGECQRNHFMFDLVPNCCRCHWLHSVFCSVINIFEDQVFAYVKVGLIDDNH